MGEGQRASGTSANASNAVSGAKRTYTRPTTTNVVSRRTMTYGAKAGKQKFQAQTGIANRANRMREMLNNTLVGRRDNGQWTLNRERIARAESNMLRRTRGM